MKPEDVTARFVTAIQDFPPITGCPSDENLKKIKDIITPILITLPYDSINGVHNLWGIIATPL